jgi:hypothetical protein
MELSTRVVSEDVAFFMDVVQENYIRVIHGAPEKISSFTDTLSEADMLRTRLWRQEEIEGEIATEIVVVASAIYEWAPFSVGCRKPSCAFNKESLTQERPQTFTSAQLALSWTVG